MNYVNLYDYVSCGTFLKNLAANNPFDAIVFEKLPEGKIDTKNFNILTFEQLNYDFGFSGIISGLSKNYKNILIVLDSLNLTYILPFIENSKKNNFTIINLGSGASGYVNKKNPDTNDIGFLTNYDIKIYEPFDFLSFFKILIEKTNKYIRIANKGISNNIFGDNKNVFDPQNGYIDLRGFDLEGENGTILCGGYMISEVLQSVQLLQKKGQNFDLFCFYDYGFKLDKNLLQSIEKTTKLIIIADTKNIETIVKQIIVQLYKKQLNTNIEFIIPNFPKIQTKLVDYVYSQAEFDTESITKKLLSIG